MTFTDIISKEDQYHVAVARAAIAYYIHIACWQLGRKFNA